MKMTNVKQINKFLDLVDKCAGSVWLESIEGDKYNLKSQLSQYIAIGALLSNHGDKLELFCSNPADEPLFFEFFNENPETL